MSTIRDIELMILILKNIKENYSPGGYFSNNIRVDEYSGVEISYNLQLLMDKGYVKIWNESTHHQSPYRTYLINRVTDKGEDFIQMSENKVWGETKKKLVSIGNFTLEIVSKIFAEIILKTMDIK